MVSRSADQPPPAAPSTSPRAKPAPWLTWALLALFVFMAFECTLLAFALRGPWFILVAPALVCGIKAWDTWRQVRRAARP